MPLNESSSSKQQVLFLSSQLSVTYIFHQILSILSHQLAFVNLCSTSGYNQISNCLLLHVRPEYLHSKHTERANCAPSNTVPQLRSNLKDCISKSNCIYSFKMQNYRTIEHSQYCSNICSKKTYEVFLDITEIFSIFINSFLE